MAVDDVLAERRPTVQGGTGGTSYQTYDAGRHGNWSLSGLIEKAFGFQLAFQTLQAG
jgi:hypothetical protein